MRRFLACGRACGPALGALGALVHLAPAFPFDGEPAVAFIYCHRYNLFICLGNGASRILSIRTGHPWSLLRRLPDAGHPNARKDKTSAALETTGTIRPAPVWPGTSRASVAA